jgi:DNA-binding transcriptional LysR family regulator
VNLKQLRAFVTIAETGSFAEAAERLFLTPAAISLQMRTLEEELGTELFDRKRRPPELNAHGRYLVPYAQEALATVQNFTVRARSTDDLAGTLALGCISGITSDLLPRVLRNLRRNYPSVGVRIEESDSGSLTQRVVRRELDAAIVTDPAVRNPDLEYVEVTSESMMVIAATRHRGKTDIELLDRLPFLSLSPASGVGQLTDAELKRRGIVTRPAMQLDSTVSVIQMAAAGLGVGIVPAQKSIRGTASRVWATPFGSPPLMRKVVFVERPESQRSDLARAIYNELIAIL